MGRPNTLAQTGGETFVTKASYGPSSEPASVTAFGIVNWWSYNSMLQVTQTAQDGIQMTYGYSATQNNGKVASAKDATLGETVNYTYDLLNRLAAAKATDNAWGNAYVYDGYGNLLQKNVTAGSAPSLLQTVNVGNNQINTTQRDTYDANGNQTGTYSFAGVVFQYDIENRVVAIQGEGAVYAYNAQNQRVWRATTVSGKTTEVFYFYGIDGKMIQSYAPTYPVYQGETYMALGTEEQGLYFAGRLVGRSSGLGSLEAVSTDGIGTARWDNSLNGLEAWFYPWGEERGTVTADDRVKFATYRRDSESSLDYAGNRYYDNVTGRFLSPDPYMANSGGPGVPSDPQSWNRYAYVLGDPVSHSDRTGLYVDAEDCIEDPAACEADDWGGGWGVGVGFGGGGFGGGGSFVPVLGPNPNWQTWGQVLSNVSAWDALIASALVGESQQRVSEPGYRYVAYLKDVGDCYRNQAFGGGSVVRERTYEAFDEFGNPYSSPTLTISEHNYVQSGSLSAYGGVWHVDQNGEFTDILSRGGGPDTTEFQQFSASNSSGLNSFANMPVMVYDATLPNGPFFGTLGIVLRQHSVWINGNSGVGLPPCN